jgi:hypothetical protein
VSVLPIVWEFVKARLENESGSLALSGKTAGFFESSSRKNQSARDFAQGS